MGIGVEQAEAVVGAVNETVDGLPPAVAQLLLGGEGVAPGFALNELLGQHPTSAQLADHLRHVDERVPAVELGELGLVGSLEPVVELLGDAYADLLRCAPKVEAHFPRGETEQQSEERGKQLGVLQVGVDRGRHPGILDLHGDRATVVQPGGVNLADRGRRERLPLELHERLSVRWPSSRSSAARASSGAIGGASSRSRVSADW